MSWLNPRKQFYNMVCTVIPKGSMCQAHLMAEYPECFPNKKPLIKSFLELPMRLWKYTSTGGTCQTHDAYHPCCALYPDESEHNILASVFKFLFILAASILILFAILKVAGQRRPLAQ